MKSCAIVVGMIFALTGCSSTSGTGTGGTGSKGREDAGTTGGAGGQGAGGIGDAGREASANTGGSPGDGGASGGTGGVPASCTAALVTPVAPVVVAADISCTGTVDAVNVAAGSGSNGVVALGANHGTSPSFLFDIGASGVRVEPILSDALETHLPANAGGTMGIVEGLRGKSSAVWLTRASAGSSSGWTSTTISNSILNSATDCAIGPDNAQHATFLDGNGTLTVATREVGAGAFATTSIAGLSPTRSVPVIDTGGGLHVFSWMAGRGLVDWQPGRDLVTALPSPMGDGPRSMEGVRPSGLGVALSLQLSDGIHIVRRRSDGAFDDITIPSSMPTPFVSPGAILCTGGSTCPAVTQLGDYARGHALAEAADGTLWFATVSDHVDRTIKYVHQGEACLCAPQATQSTDKSSSSLVLHRIAPGSVAPSAILWSSSSPTNGLPAMSATISGALLILAVSASANELHYFAIDTAKLE